MLLVVALVVGVAGCWLLLLLMQWLVLVCVLVHGTCKLIVCPCCCVSVTAVYFCSVRLYLVLVLHGAAHCCLLRGGGCRDSASGAVRHND